MSKVKRLRIFAGPNGSGKSTLFEAFQQKNYKPGIFINSKKRSLKKDFLIYCHTVLNSLKMISLIFIKVQMQKPFWKNLK